MSSPTPRKTLPAGDLPIRHGYRIDDVRKLAVRAAASHYTSRVLPHDERVDVAWYAIVEHLYTAEQYPSPTHLGHIAQVAISRATQNGDHHAGIDRRNNRTMPRFAAYWSQRVTGSPEEGIVERLALAQVLQLVSAGEAEALVALATLDTQAAAADALGLTMRGLQSRLARGRQVIYAAWFEGEVPPARRRDRRVGSYSESVAA